MTFANSAEPICNVSERLRAMAAARPEAAAILDPTGSRATGERYRQISFAALERDVERIARGLVAVGIRPGQRLALLVPPSIEFITLVFALLRAGAVQILIDPGMGRKHLLNCLCEAEPTGFVTIPRGQVVRAIFRRWFPLAKWNITVGRKLWPGWWSLDEIRRLGETTVVNSTVATNLCHKALPHTVANDPAAIIFTTGSTGPPKGVLYRYGNFDRQVAEIQAQYQIQPGEIDVPCFPLFGLFNAAMGVTTVLPVMDFSRPAACDPRRIIDDAIIANRATQSFASPAVWSKVGAACAEWKITFPHLRRVLSAGAPVSGNVLKRMVAALGPEAEMHTPYGATEALPVATISAREVLRETWPLTEQGRGVCVGRRFAGIRWRIIRAVNGPIATLADAVELAPGEVGELIVSGPVVTTEYVTRREVNALAKIADPAGGIWHRMGDVGYLDRRERFWICGRLAHRVLTANGPLDSLPWEEVLNTVNGVRRTALVGIGPSGQQDPVVIVEPDTARRRWLGKRLPAAGELDSLRAKILAHAANFPQLAALRTILFHPDFPVDIRHNAKIFREKLAVWAEERLRNRSTGDILVERRV